MGTLKEMLANDRFAVNAGVELLEIQPGYAKARMLITQNHLNAGGVCQGGALFTLADLAFCRCGKQPSETDTFLECQHYFLAPGARRVCLRRGIRNIQSCPRSVYRSENRR